MCGILGVVNFNGLTQKDLDYFTDIFVKSKERGIDASGVAIQNLSYHKKPVPSNEFVKTREYKKILKKAIGKKWIIGHTRWATQGDPKNNKNNHPLTALPGKFLMVHNGVVGTDKFDSNETKTDSYIVAQSIKKAWVEGNLQKSVKDAYKKFWGNATIAVITPKEISIIKRNNPLFINRFSGRALSFASKKEFLEGHEGDDITEVDNNSGVSFDIEGHRKFFEVSERRRPIVTYNNQWFEPGIYTGPYYQKPEPRVRDIPMVWERDEEDEIFDFEPPKELEEEEKTLNMFFNNKLREYRRKRGKGWHKENKRHSRAAQRGWKNKMMERRWGV